MKTLGRKSLRLKGYDYGKPGAYFVTICTRNRVCTLCEIQDGIMRLSRTGEIAEHCWKAIPAHFEHTRVNVFQMMPNHVHGIIEIREIPSSNKTRRGEVPSPKIAVHQGSNKGDVTSPLQKITLGRIVAYFKYQATKQINVANGTPGRKVFQRNYYDHIIRSDIDHYCIQRYIELNPLLWQLDSDNPEVHEMPIDELKRTLKERHGLEDHAIAYLIDCEMDYREWHEEETNHEGFPLRLHA